MSSTESVRFGDETWIKGTRGTEDPAHSQRAVIRNLRRGGNGVIGPRPLWSTSEVEIPTKFGLASVIVPAQYRYLGSYVDGYLCVDNGDVEFIITDDEDATYTGTYGNTYAASSQASSVTDMNASVFKISDTRWLINDLLIDLRTETVSVGTRPITVTSVETAIETEFGIFSMTVEGSTIHQGRAFYWGYGTDAVATPFPTNRVYYSDSVITNGYDGYVEFGQYPGAASGAGASQYFDVDGEVEGCVSVGPNLMIWTREGRWFMMQGSGDPANATFSYLGLGKIPGYERFPTQLDRTAVFLSSDGMSLCVINAGGQIEEMEMKHLAFDITATAYGTDATPVNIATSSLQNSALMPYQVDTARHLVEGMWTDEEWEIVTYSDFQVWSDEINAKEMLAIYTPGASTQWQIHTRPIAGVMSASLAQDYSEYEEDYTGDSRGYLQLPRLFKPLNQIRVKRVVIDGYNYNSTTVPDPSLVVKVADGKGNTTTLNLGPGSVMTAVDGAVRIVATGELPYTHFSDVSIEDIAGFYLDSVTVEFEVSKGLIQ